MSINTQAGPIIGGKEPSVILNPRKKNLTSLGGDKEGYLQKNLDVRHWRRRCCAENPFVPLSDL